MVQQIINIGADPNDGTGDPLRDAMEKTNENFTELYASGSAAYNVANAAFARANSALGGGGPSDPGVVVFFAYDQANLALSVARNAYNTANSENLARIVYNVANSSFGQGNTAHTQANNAYNRANLAFIQANNAFTSSNAALDVANAAFEFANVLSTYTFIVVGDPTSNGAGGIVGETANIANIAIAAYRTANAAFDQANTGGGGGGGASNITNAVFAATNSAFSAANAAFAKANNALANTTGTFEGDLTVKGNTIFLRDVSASPSTNTLIFHGTTFGFGTDNAQNYEPNYVTLTIGGIDSRFPGSPGRHGDIVWQGNAEKYVADFYVLNDLANTFVQYYNSPVLIDYDNQSMQFKGSNTVFSNTTFNHRVGINRNNPTYALDVFGTINAAAVLVNGSPISAGGAAFDKANAANLMAYTASIGAAAASINASAAFDAANGAFAAANIAIANVNFVNIATSSAFATSNASFAAANAAFNKANLWLLSSNVAPVSAIANSFWFNTDTAELYVYYKDWDGTEQWVQTNGSFGGGQAFKDINYYLMFFYPGFVDANVPMYINNVPTKFYLPANLTGSYATVETAPSGNNANLRIQRNGAFVGNIEFARNNTNGTFVFANTVTFEKGDKIRIMSPSIVDPAMSDISISLVGVKTE